MNRLDDLIKEYCPDGVVFRRISEVATVERGKRVVREQLPETGKYRVYQNSLTPLGFFNDSNYKHGTAFVIGAGAAGEIGFSDDDFWAADDCYPLVCGELVNGRYLYHILLSKQIYISSQVRKGSIPRLSRSVIENICIPVPPIEVQCEIVRILDDYATKTEELKEKLSAELSARKKQYEFYRDAVLAFDSSVPRVELGSTAKVTKLAGFEFTNYVKYSSSGKIIALRGLNVKEGRIVLDDVKYIDNSDLSKLERSKLVIGDMLFTYVGTVGQVALIDENDKYYLAPNVALIRADNSLVNPKYLMYYFQSTEFKRMQIDRLLQSSSMKNIPMEKIRKFMIPVPSLEIQNEIVNLLERFDTLCNDISSGLPAEIEARQKQYEFYRDKLLSFKELGA